MYIVSILNVLVTLISSLFLLHVSGLVCHTALWMRSLTVEYTYVYQFFITVWKKIELELNISWDIMTVSWISKWVDLVSGEDVMLPVGTRKHAFEYSFGGYRPCFGYRPCLGYRPLLGVPALLGEVALLGVPALARGTGPCWNTSLAVLQFCQLL